MKQAAEIIKSIQVTSGTNSKKAILQRNRLNVPMKDILKFIYNPYVRTGISASKLNKIQGMMEYDTIALGTIDYKEAIDYFTTHRTGSDADLMMAARFINCTKNTYLSDVTTELATCIVTQNLKIGVSAKTLNEIFGNDFIPMTGCMFGKLYGDVGPTKTEWPCIVTEKLDGQRRILIKENNTVKFFTRSGHEDFGLVDILEETKYLPTNAVFDGELLAIGNFKNSIEQRQATNSLASRDGDKHGLTFNVFDMIPTDEFYAGISRNNALVRKITLGATLMDESISILDHRAHELIQAFGIHNELNFIKHVPILGYVSDITEVDPIVTALWKNGREGVMLNTATGLYEIKRTKHLLKVKNTEEIRLTIVDMFEGTGKYEDMLGAVVVDYKGTKVGVGSGFTDQQRRAIWENPNTYIGKLIEIDHFGESKNKSGGISLNCPIFKRFV